MLVDSSLLMSRFLAASLAAKMLNDGIYSSVMKTYFINMENISIQIP